MEHAEHNPGEQEFGDHAEDAPHNPGEQEFGEGEESGGEEAPDEGAEEDANA